ncbi:MAG: M48 family peptidase [Calditrichaeota bacterium]|nr:MAG: M48 family peptidase [Calditrichota bacterium]MBL1203796.1 M48 family peptidase [Calditrichota bacterium]NOG43626.1 M48 family metallopeptidase [Calditrichota bacterium]
MEATNLQKAKQYEKINLVLSIFSTILSIVILILFVTLGYSAQLRDVISEWFENSYLQLLVFLFSIGLGYSVISFPLSFFGDFWLEHYFDLSNQTFFAWMWEKIKGFLVGLVLGVPLILAFYFFLLNYPATWWFWTATILFFFSIIIGKIAPQVIFPLFYKFEKLNDESLLTRMKSLAEKGKFSLEGVYRFDMSKSTKKANAAFTGMGKTKRIILGDTLIEKFNEDEIEGVFAHEVGHYVHKHIIQGVVVGTISSYLSLYIAHLVFSEIIVKYNFSSVADLAALPILSLIITVISLISSPLSNMLSRHNERQADTYALQNSTNPAAFIEALQKLAESNLSDPEPHPLIEFLFHSHPSVANRVKFAEGVLNQ